MQRRIWDVVLRKQPGEFPQVQGLGLLDIRLLLIRM